MKKPDSIDVAERSRFIGQLLRVIGYDVGEELWMTEWKADQKWRSLNLYVQLMYGCRLSHCQIWEDISCDRELQYFFTVQGHRTGFPSNLSPLSHIGACVVVPAGLLFGSPTCAFFSALAIYKPTTSHTACQSCSPFTTYCTPPHLLAILLYPGGLLQ